MLRQDLSRFFSEGGRVSGKDGLWEPSAVFWPVVRHRGGDPRRGIDEEREGREIIWRLTSREGGGGIHRGGGQDEIIGQGWDGRRGRVKQWYRIW